MIELISLKAWILVQLAARSSVLSAITGIFLEKILDLNQKCATVVMI